MKSICASRVLYHHILVKLRRKKILQYGYKSKHAFVEENIGQSRNLYEHSGVFFFLMNSGDKDAKIVSDKNSKNKVKKISI